MGVAAVTFLTVYRLGELLGAPRLAAEGRRPVSTPVIGAALRSALAKRPGVFRPVAAHPATEMALVSAYRELRDLTSGSARRRFAPSPTGPADVVRLHGEVRRALEPPGTTRRTCSMRPPRRSRQDIRLGGDSGGSSSTCRSGSRSTARRCSVAVAERGEVVVIAGTTGDPRADAETD